MKEKPKALGAKAGRLMVWGILLGVVCLFSGCGKKEAVFVAEAPPLENGENTTGEGRAFGAEDSPGQWDTPEGPDSGKLPDSSWDSPENEEELIVYVCGQVQKPGVYALKAGARVGDAVDMAGGMTEEAAADAINLAQTVGDAQMIRVPSLAEVEELGPGYVLPDTGGGPGAGGGAGSSGEGKISLNRATREQLMTLPGIGASKADAILLYRQEKGAFENIEELMNITGIKEGVFLKIKDQITI